MDLGTLTMDRTAARKAFLAYKHSVKARHTEEDAAIMEAYRQIARGRQVLNLVDTFALGGTVNQAIGRATKRNVPRLAICRADQERVRLWRRRGALDFDWGNQGTWDRRLRQDRWRMSIPFDWGDTEVNDWTLSFTAAVPLVPAPLKPARDLSGYHILWEAEWSPIRVPKDPALLKRLAKGLYAVIAVWDLTPVEQAVLAGRRVTS